MKIPVRNLKDLFSTALCQDTLFSRSNGLANKAFAFDTVVRFRVGSKLKLHEIGIHNFLLDAQHIR